MVRADVTGQFLPIDFFLRSLASEISNRAIGVILSGSALDGVLGLMEIKSAAGITFAQDEDSAAKLSMSLNTLVTSTYVLELEPSRKE